MDVVRAVGSARRFWPPTAATRRRGTHAPRVRERFRWAQFQEGENFAWDFAAYHAIGLFHVRITAATNGHGIAQGTGRFPRKRPQGNSWAYLSIAAPRAS